MLRTIILIAALGACGDNLKAPRDAGGDAAPVDASADAAPQALGPCLDRPTDLARPPANQLPCELLPPGFHP
jgi:hypothetical protein